MTNRSFSFKQNRKLFISLSGILLIMFTTLYLSRAWLRTTGMSWYANTFYMPTVTRRFNNDLGYVNEQLAALGIEVGVAGPTEGCGDSQYQGFRVSLGCIKTASSGEVYDNEQFLENWQQKTQEFEDDLFSKGWVQINNIDQDITELLDPTKYQPELTYSLTQGKVSCSVRIGYNKYDTENRRVFVDEYCGRSIEIFGGY